jgi:hypothetical protein
VNNWDEFLAGATRARDEAIRQMTRTGRPAGDAAFVGLVERLTARNLAKGIPGRPVKKGRENRYYVPRIRYIISFAKLVNPKSGSRLKWMKLQ